MLNKKQIRKWCRALRNPKYKQVKGKFFGEKKNEYCAQGLPVYALNLAINEVLDTTWYFYLKTDFSISQLNDSNFSFNEIADILEAIYLLEVLK